MRNYISNDFRKIGVTEINIQCGCNYIKDSDIAHTFIIDFKQFIPHRDNENPDPVIGNSLTVSKLEHRILEVGSIEEGLEKVIIVASRALGLIANKDEL